jgi:hypothetical protein
VGDSLKGYPAYIICDIKKDAINASPPKPKAKQETTRATMMLASFGTGTNNKHSGK